MKEVEAVAQAKGVLLDPDLVGKTLSLIDSSPPDLKPSMQRDLETGRLFEVESMIGVVVQMGAELDVPTPVMRFAYGMLKPGELKARMQSRS
jgi:2-dehydropantoate 2-reductase